MDISKATMRSGLLTFRSDDGYVVNAPVEFFEATVDTSYDDVRIDYLLDSHRLFQDSYSVDFRARLKYGESYTVRDLGVTAYKTLTVKGNIEELRTTHEIRKRRNALGVPADATVRYNPKKDETTFKWQERVVVSDD